MIFTSNLRKNWVSGLLSASLIAATAGTASANIANNETGAASRSAIVSAPDIVIPTSICDNLRRQFQYNVVITEKRTTTAADVDFLRKWYMKKAVIEVIQVSPSILGRFQVLQMEQRAINAKRPYEVRDETQRALSDRWRTLSDYIERGINASCQFDVEYSSNPEPQPNPRKPQRKKSKAKTVTP